MRADRPRRPGLGLRFPIECGLPGDARATLQALIPLLTRKDDRGFLTEIQAEVKDWNALAERGRPDKAPMRGDVAVEALKPAAFRPFGSTDLRRQHRQAAALAT